MDIIRGTCLVQVSGYPGVVKLAEKNNADRGGYLVDTLQEAQSTVINRVYIRDDEIRNQVFVQPVQAVFPGKKSVDFQKFMDDQVVINQVPVHRIAVDNDNNWCFQLLLFA